MFSRELSKRLLILHCPSTILCCIVPRCPWAFLSHRLRRFSILGGPVLSSSVSLLLGRLLHEELAMRWEQLLLDEAFTGGALAWLPGRTARAGQLVYPSGGALDKLSILSHVVGILRPSTEWSRGRVKTGDKNPSQSLTRGSDFQEVSVNSGGNLRVLEDPGHIQLRGPVRQVVTSTVQGESESLSLAFSLPLFLLVQLATIPASAIHTLQV